MNCRDGQQQGAAVGCTSKKQQGPAAGNSTAAPAGSRECLAGREEARFMRQHGNLGNLRKKGQKIKVQSHVWQIIKYSLTEEYNVGSDKLLKSKVTSGKNQFALGEEAPVLGWLVACNHSFHALSQHRPCLRVLRLLLAPDHRPTGWPAMATHRA